MTRKSKFSILLRRRVQVVLRDSRTIHGQLLAYDKCMNVVLSETVDKRGEQVRSLGLVILRGESIVSMTVDNAFVTGNVARVPASLIIEQRTADIVN